jgi:hypothetical protein
MFVPSHSLIIVPASRHPQQRRGALRQKGLKVLQNPLRRRYTQMFRIEGEELFAVEQTVALGKSRRIK